MHMLQTGPGDNAIANLERADTAWQRLCNAETMPYKEVIREVRQHLPQTSLQQHAYDVAVLGGAGSQSVSLIATSPLPIKPASACTCCCSMLQQRLHLTEPHADRHAGHLPGMRPCHARQARGGCGEGAAAGARPGVEHLAPGHAGNSPCSCLITRLTHGHSEAMHCAVIPASAHPACTVQ